MLSRRFLLLIGALLLSGASGCGGDDPPAPVAPETPAPVPTIGPLRKKRPPFTPGTSIVVAGKKFDVDTPVVLWSDPIGYDAYSERCYSLPQVLPQDAASRPNADPKRYAARSPGPLPAAAEKRVREHGWRIEELRQAVWQFVLHYDAVGSSERCFRALHDNRGLSVHFMLDLDGTIWQTLDVVERAFHAAEANDRSVGVEIANVGAFSTPKFLDAWYGRRDDGRVVNLFPATARMGDQRVESYVAAPWRNELVAGFIHGRKLVQHDFTEAQYVALAKLAAGLNRALPRIKLASPRDKAGKVETRMLREPRRSTFEGVVGHFHLTESKTDPGPAFDWEWFLKAAAAEAARR
jgi:N-acetyl-anhydromuramyl-L-alanine amidase AmpD